MDCSPQASSVHGISQARILEWVAISFSRGFSQPRDGTWVCCIAGGLLHFRQILDQLSPQGSFKIWCYVNLSMWVCENVENWNIFKSLLVWFTTFTYLDKWKGSLHLSIALTDSYVKGESISFHLCKRLIANVTKPKVIFNKYKDTIQREKKSHNSTIMKQKCSCSKAKLARY